MAQLGFICFDSAPVVAAPTLRQQWAALSAETARKNIVYYGFKDRIPAAIIREKVQLSIELIEYVYNIMDQMRDRATAMMRGTAILTPAILDAQGNVITSATYVTVPTTAIELRQAIAAEFVDDIPGADCNTIINLMIASSNYTGNATWTFYSTNIKL